MSKMSWMRKPPRSSVRCGGNGMTPMFEGKRAFWSVFFAALVMAVLCAAPVVADAQSQEPELQLRLRRDFGYGSGAQIQGRFSIIVDGPEDLARVVFFVDDEVIGEDAEAPFRMQLNTSNYELGWHTLRATGFTGDGREIASNALQRQFVSGSTSTIVLVAFVLLIVGFRVVSHLVTRNKAPGEQKGYGVYGGAVCKRCGRPFARKWWSPNLLVGKLERCPHCGKWQFTTRATPVMLERAEQFAQELDAEAASTLGEVDEEEKLRRRLDESRFD